jgi:isocitrate lyase
MWRPSPEQVQRLRGQLDFPEQYVFARKASEKLRKLLAEKPYIATFGALSGTQAAQMAKAGLDSIYLSGWQTAASENDQVYPDMGLYNTDSVPNVIRKINNALKRASQIDVMEGGSFDFLCPIVADAEHGFGGMTKTYELIRAMITEGTAGIHLENQAMDRRCGHLAGKMLIPSSEFVGKLKAARLAAEVCDVDLVIVARTDAKSAQFITSDIDERDVPFITQRTKEGPFKITGGVDQAIANGLACAEYADLLWMEDSTPSLENAEKFAAGIHEKYPGKMLAFNCSPSFNWEKYLTPEKIFTFQKDLAKVGYRYFFITLCGWHLTTFNTFDFAQEYRTSGVLAYSDLQQRELALEKTLGYSAVKHQREVGTSYFDLVTSTLDSNAQCLAMEHSTESEQFGSK